MTIKGRSQIVQNVTAKAQYVTIPSAMTQDSQYPFRPYDEVELELSPDEKTMVVRFPGHSKPKETKKTKAARK